MSLALLGQAIIKKTANKKIRINSKIDELKSKFNGGCPTTPELVRIINQRNQLVNILTQLKRQIITINKTVNPLKTLLTILNTASKTLKLAPLPVAFGAPAVALPIGTIVSAGDALQLINQKITGFKSNISAFNKITEYILRIIDELLNKLKSLDVLIEKCANENAQQATRQAESTLGNVTNLNQSGTVPNSNASSLIINNLLNAEESGLIDQLQSPNDNNVNTYKGFVLEVLLDDKNDTRFPKRFAVAKTPNGIIVLRGESSFSSSVNVLLDEIKFIIDRDNLTL